MPRLSDSMEEGTIVRWLKADGDEVRRGEELVEIETDKATMTYEADAAGTLRIAAVAGDTLPIGAVIAFVGDGMAPVPAPATAAVAETAPAAPAVAQGTVAEPVAAGVTASPVARRVARDHDVDLQKLTGTGPRGRILKADVLRALDGPDAGLPEAPPAAEARGAAVATPPPATPPQPVGISGAAGSAKGDVRVQELSRTQAVIARRMAESKATVPEFTISTQVDMEGAVELRAQLKALAGGQRPVPSFNDMVVKACALALREFPRANGSYRDGRFELYSRVNVGVAVAAADALVVPTLFDADQKTLGQIAAEARALAERVRAGAITPPELSGGTFTVSNLGMYGVTQFTAVINPPQAAILAVGRMEPRAVVRDGQIVARNAMDITLACDHRILYGADAALFLARIRELLEQPIALAL